MTISQFDDDLKVESEPQPEVASVPATEIVKAVKKAGKKTKRGAKAPKKAKKAPAKKTAAKPKKPAKAHKLGKSGKRRGPGAGGKLVRSGDMVYGAKVRKARDAKEWTGKELAKKLGITQPAVCNVEKGTAPASEALMARIFKVLGVAPATKKPRKARAKKAKK